MVMAEWEEEYHGCVGNRRDGGGRHHNNLSWLAASLLILLQEVLVVLRVRDEEDQTASLVSESAHLLVGQDHVTGAHLLVHFCQFHVVDDGLCQGAIFCSPLRRPFLRD